jgi:beta-glucosidase
MPRVSRRLALPVLVLLSGAALAPAAPDPALERKIDGLLAKMTFEEKLGQLQQLSIGVGGVVVPVAVEEGPLAEAIRLARAGRLGSALNLTNLDAAARLQRAARGSRLGIPLIVGFDVIHGYRTVFPTPLAEASSWNPALAEHDAEIAAREAAAVGIHWTFAPMVDIARDARWGRIAEGAGEDPVLGRALAGARVRGFHKGGIAACAKHYVAYGAAEAGRDYNTVELPESLLRDVYLPPFRAALDAGAETFMSAFNAINGVPASGNRHTLTEILRSEWGFDGFVVSDWNSVVEMVNHAVAKDCTDAARIAINAGVDMEMVSTCYAEGVPGLLEQGLVKKATLDEAVRRVLRVKYRLGLFDKKDPDPAAVATVLLAPEHRKAAREAARESMVLLRDEGATLPFSASLRSLAVVGPLADDGLNQLGSWFGDGQPQDSVTVLAGIRARAGARVKVTYAKGCEIGGSSPDGFAAAVAAAREADAVVAVLGESIDMSGEGGSRAFLTLPGVQQQLLETMVATGKPVVLVLMAGRPLDIRWAAERVPAILMAWQPGSEGGNAVADLLFGDAAPSGHLPVSWPRSVGQLPLYYAQLPTGRPASPTDRTTSRYVDESNDPLYPFGFGLTYTSFTYSRPRLSAPATKADGSLDVTVTVRNTGARAGADVVQLYVRDLVASRSRPLRELKAFQKLALGPGEEKSVVLKLRAKDLGFHDDAGHYHVEPGAFKLWVGGSAKADSEGGCEIR